MANVVGSLVVVLVLVFLFRKQIKRASQRRTEHETAVDTATLSAIIACERARMEQPEKPDGDSGSPPRCD